jgi:hypothetical protein
MPGDTREEPLKAPALGHDGSLLQVPEKFAEAVKGVPPESEPFSRHATQLPQFLRSFYLRFLDEVLDISIERFTVEERDEISDRLVDLQQVEERQEVWPLLEDFIDFSDYIDDFGLLSAPDTAQEHQTEILELTVRVLRDLGTWADAHGLKELSVRCKGVANKLEALNLTEASE